MRPAAHRARPVRVTNEGKEMADEEQEKFDKEYMNLGPQFQIPNPELGPLEKRVQTTFVEGLLSGDIKPEDSDYWFTEPEGRLPILLALPSLLQTATLPCVPALSPAFHRDQALCACQAAGISKTGYLRKGYRLL